MSCRFHADRPRGRKTDPVLRLRPPLPRSATSRCPAQYEVFVLSDQRDCPNRKLLVGVKTMNWKKFNVLGRDWIENSFKTLVDRKSREQHHDQRRLAEQRTTKHRVQARKSC